MRTQLPELMLVNLRAQGFAHRAVFVDPHVLNKALTILRRRGEEWVSSVLGHDLTKRSLIDSAQAYLVDGEQYTLIAADRAEDQLALAEIPEVANG